jgi:hypothetical protein
MTSTARANQPPTALVVDTRGAAGQAVTYLIDLNAKPPPGFLLARFADDVARDGVAVYQNGRPGAGRLVVNDGTLSVDQLLQRVHEVDIWIYYSLSKYEQYGHAHAELAHTGLPSVLIHLV